MVSTTWQDLDQPPFVGASLLSSLLSTPPISLSIFLRNFAYAYHSRFGKPFLTRSDILTLGVQARLKWYSTSNAPPVSVILGESAFLPGFRQPCWHLVSASRRFLACSSRRSFLPQHGDRPQQPLRILWKRLLKMSESGLINVVNQMVSYKCHVECNFCNLQ